MVRTQIQLPEAQFEQLKRAALDEGVSMAELIRRGIERVLGERDDVPARKHAAMLAVLGTLDSGLPDLARDHDRYLNEGDRW